MDPSANSGLEVLPAYWGIETDARHALECRQRGLEVLPAYWGIETPITSSPDRSLAWFRSTTRLLGY